MEPTQVALRDGGEKITGYDVNIHRKVDTFDFSGEEVSKIVMFISAEESDDGELHVHLHCSCINDQIPFHEHDAVDLVWLSNKREASSDTQKEEKARAVVVNTYSDTIVVRVNEEHVEKVKQSQHLLHRNCFVFTRVTYFKEPSYYGFPIFVEDDNMPGWMIVSSKECDEKYPGLVHRDQFVAVHALAEDECAIPTITFQPQKGGLDECTYGSLALIVKKEELPNSACAQPLSLSIIEDPFSFDGGLLAADDDKKDAGKEFPKLTQRMEPTFENFSPHNFVVSDSGVMVWPSIHHQSRGHNHLLSIIWKEGAATKVYDLGRYSIDDITSKALIHGSQVWVGAVTERGDYRMVCITEDKEPYIPADTYGDPIRHLKWCEKDDAVRVVSSCSHVTFETFSNGAFMLGRGAQEEPGNVHLYSSITGESFSEQRICNSAGHFVYAASDFGSLGVVCLRKLEDEHGDLCQTKISFISKEPSRNVHKTLNYMPLDVCVAGDNAVWITGTLPGSVIRYDPDDSSYLPLNRQREFKVCTESIVEIIRNGEDGSVFAFSLKHVFLIQNDGVFEKRPDIRCNNLWGICLKATDDLNISSMLASSPSDTESRVAPIDFYTGERKEIRPFNNTIVKDGDTIESVNLGGDHDVLVNAQLRDCVMVQHLADVRLVNRKKIKISESDKPFVISGFKTIASLALANDPFGCVRAREIYSLLEEVDYSFHGVLFHQDVFMKNTTNGYVGAGVLCSADYASQFTDTFLYYAYGSRFWER